MLIKDQATESCMGGRLLMSGVQIITKFEGFSIELINLRARIYLQNFPERN